MAVLLAALLCASGALAQDAPRFSEQGIDRNNGTRYMTFAGGRVGELSFESSGERYVVTDADGRACVWGDGLLAEDGFQAEMLPRSIEEAARMNRVQAYLNDTDMLGWSDAADLRRGETRPVYAAPEGRYADVPYVLELRGSDGGVARYGFAIGADADWTGAALDVRKGEGGGGYLKLEEGLAYRPVYTGECGW